MKIRSVTLRSLLALTWVVGAWGCGDAPARTTGSAGSGLRSSAGSAAVGTGGAAGHGFGGAGAATEMAAGKPSTTGGAGGAGGIDARGAGSGGAGLAGDTADGSGRSGMDGYGGAVPRAGQGPGGNGESGATSGGLGGSLQQAGAGGTGAQGGAAACPALVAAERAISFGTLLSADGVTCSARMLAAALSNPSAPGWRAKGDQHRKYRFADANADVPYRLYVPTTWNGTASLPLALFLHGSGSDENTYVDQNGGQLSKLAEQHGFLLVAPLGAEGAYGNFLRLSSPFGKPDEAAKLMAAVTSDSERTNELSERDVINVLELVLAEYPVERGALFLFGHSMGSGGTWYLGGKYSAYWRGLAPMSGPFVQEDGYPWDELTLTHLFVTEGTQAPSLDGSRALRDWLRAHGFDAEYEEVAADHPGMVPLVLPDVFEFFERAR